MAFKNPQEPFTRISVREAQQMLDEGKGTLFDVREPGEYAGGHAAAAKLLPLNSVFPRKDELPDDQDLLFICQVGQRSALAAEYAAAAGKTRIYNVEGGTDAWKLAGLPLE